MIVKIRNDEPEDFAPRMPGEDDAPNPNMPPDAWPLVRYTTPIDERGHAGDAMRHRLGSTQNGNPGQGQTKQTSAPAPKGGKGKSGKGC